MKKLYIKTNVEEDIWSSVEACNRRMEKIIRWGAS